jgi:hypothetical protein
VVADEKAARDGFDRNARPGGRGANGKKQLVLLWLYARATRRRVTETQEAPNAEASFRQGPVLS